MTKAATTNGKSHRPTRWHRPTKWEAVSFVISLALAVILGGVLANFTRPDTWSPLGPYPDQTVVSQGPKVKADGNQLVPVVFLDGSPVQTIGTKCVKEDVSVYGWYGWRSVSPPGPAYWPEITKEEAFERGAEVRLKTKGPDSDCGVELRFDNDIPPEVVEWARSLISKGVVPEVMLTGTEIPIDKNGNQGKQITWRTERMVLALAPTGK